MQETQERLDTIMRRRRRGGDFQYLHEVEQCWSTQAERIDGLVRGHSQEDGAQQHTSCTQSQSPACCSAASHLHTHVKT